MDSNRYENGRIYKIVNVGYNKCYIGSTCESLTLRFNRHKWKYNQYLKGSTDITRSFLLFDEFGIDNCKIELIENYSCNNKEELLKREGYFIENNDCINKQIAGRSREQWVLDNKEHLQNYKNKYYEEHKEECKERVKQHKEDNKEHYYTYYQEYKVKNRDKINQKNKEYYQQVKEEKSKKVECKICGKTVRNDYMNRHQKTSKCQSFINNSSSMTIG